MVWKLTFVLLKGWVRSFSSWLTSGHILNSWHCVFHKYQWIIRELSSRINKWKIEYNATLHVFFISWSYDHTFKILQKSPSIQNQVLYTLMKGFHFLIISSTNLVIITSNLIGLLVSLQWYILHVTFKSSLFFNSIRSYFTFLSISIHGTRNSMLLTFLFLAWSNLLLTSALNKKWGIIRYFS